MLSAFHNVGRDLQIQEPTETFLNMEKTDRNFHK
jgi:hypothetical protein